MKKVILVLSALFIGSALADSAPTSVGYVDNAIGALQNKISAVDNNTVLTHTNTAGEIGQKSIYDATGNYAEQQNALVTADVANAAVQNAIDTEFVCTEWLDGAPHTNENCLIYTVHNTAPNRILPTGYTPLEYIESTGTQYIYTGISGDNDNLRIVVKFRLLDFYGTQYGGYYYGGIFGNYSSENANVYRGLLASNIEQCTTSDDGCYVNFIAYANTKAGNGPLSDVYTIKLNQDYVADISQTKYSVNGDTLLTHITQGESNTKTIRLFQGGVGGTDKNALRVYYFSLYDNNVLVRNFIPARRNSDGEIGMYDTVSNQFFTNSGTGEFIAGPELNVYLPSGN